MGTSGSTDLWLREVASDLGRRRLELYGNELAAVRMEVPAVFDMMGEHLDGTTSSSLNE